jgi:hypothetical protein
LNNPIVSEGTINKILGINRDPYLAVLVLTVISKISRLRLTNEVIPFLARRNRIHISERYSEDY